MFGFGLSFFLRSFWNHFEKKAMKIGIIKEGKVPVDHRVPLTPEQCKAILDECPQAEIVVQPSDIRCFSDEDYKAQGIALQQDLSDCDVLMGVKEVPIHQLVADKTYFFFSHTIKKQPYNRGLLQEVLAKNIDLVDYECLTDAKGQRVVAFGRYAGIVGAYNGLLAWGKRYGSFQLKPAHDCLDMEELWQELDKVSLPENTKIALTGGGRVAKGAIETLERAGISYVSPEDYLSGDFDRAVYTQLDVDDYNKRSSDGGFDKAEFFADPKGYESAFGPFVKETDLFVAAAFWDPKAPALFTKEEMKEADFRIKVIADITCDIQGSVPSTLRETTIADPLYDYNPSTGEEEKALTSDKNITVMAVDNLPCELPRDASQSFGEQLMASVIPELMNGGQQPIVGGATITRKGELTEKFSYLTAFAKGEE